MPQPFGHLRRRLHGKFHDGPDDTGQCQQWLWLPGGIQFRPATTNYQYGFFPQDNWKVMPKLTLNLGLRYDVTLPRTDRYNRQDWFDPNATSPLNGGSVTYTDFVTGQPVNVALKGGERFASCGQRSNHVTDCHDFQPLFGFAYQFAPNTMVRGGLSSHSSRTFCSAGLALRWWVPKSSVREQVRTRSTDPILHLGFGKYVRFRWGSPELELGGTAYSMGQQ